MDLTREEFETVAAKVNVTSMNDLEDRSFSKGDSGDICFWFPTKLLHEINYFLDLDNDFHIILFDIETTGLDPSSEIIQIACKSTADESAARSVYLVPDTRHIAESATKVHGLSVQYKSGSKVLVDCEQRKLPAVNQNAGLVWFCRYIADQVSKSSSRVVLMAHNGDKFDFPILLKSLGRQSLLQTFKESNILLVDSLKVVTQAMKGEDSPLKGLKSKSLTSIYTFLFNEEFKAHDAEQDVEALSRISLELNFIERLHGNVSTVPLMLKRIEAAEDGKARKATLQNVPVSAGMKEKLGSAGLDIRTIREIAETGGSRALLAMLVFPVKFDDRHLKAAKPRVTKNCKILTSIINYFVKQ